MSQKIILLFLVVVMFFGVAASCRLPDGKSTNPLEPLPDEGTTPDQDELDVEKTTQMLCFMGEFMNGSCLQVIDINHDGIEELIYQPRSASWHNTTYVIKEASFDPDKMFEPFCENCSFTTYASEPVFEDLNGDQQVDVILPVVMDQENNASFDVYHFEQDDFTLFKSHPLPESEEERDVEVSDLLKQYGIDFERQ